MKSADSRIKTHSQMSAKLAGLSDASLSKALNHAQPLHTGVGGESAALNLDETYIFVKKVPLTELERLPQNYRSTANLFDLPLFYQYGVGSTGFGAWRELDAHILTTNWVISGECPHFPLLYHWRLLPAVKMAPSDAASQREKLNKDVEYWENSEAIRNRLKAIQESSSYLCLFLEYMPQNLNDWLRAQLLQGGVIAESAVELAIRDFSVINAFMKNQGFIHFDAHFKNILTDGKSLYLSDFGLANSFKFELSEEELKFLHLHHNYDQACAAVNLLHCIMTTYFGQEGWEARLQSYTTLNQDRLEPVIDSVIRRYRSIALAMDAFFQKLQKINKNEPYPSSSIQILLNDSALLTAQ